MTGLLALVADLLATSVLLGAVSAEVAVLAAVVALGAIGAIPCDALVSLDCPVLRDALL